MAAAAGTVSREREGENGGPHGPLSAAIGYTVERPPGCPGEWFALTRGAVIACYGEAVNPIASAMAADRPLACDAPALPLRQ